MEHSQFSDADNDAQTSLIGKDAIADSVIQEDLMSSQDKSIVLNNTPQGTGVASLDAQGSSNSGEIVTERNVSLESVPSVLDTEEMDRSIDVIVPDKQPVRRGSIVEIQDMLQNQDCQQVMTMVFTLVLEVYRVLMGTMLVFVVPLICSEETCTMLDRFEFNDTFSQFTIGFNFFALLSFLMLYVVEVKREYKMINYLEVNMFRPRDNESVGDALKKLHPGRLSTLLNYDKGYMYAGYSCILVYLANLGLSLGVIGTRVLNSSTYTVLLTNVLFMGTKLYNVYEVAHTEPNIFLSSYLTRKIQFNDVDPDKVDVVETTPNTICNTGSDEEKDA